MIPLFELLALKRDLDLAAALASQGRAPDGYTLLDHALHIQELREWSPWREDLIDRYRAGLAEFAGEHEICFCELAATRPITLEEVADYRRQLGARSRAQWDRSRQMRHAARGAISVQETI